MIDGCNEVAPMVKVPVRLSSPVFFLVELPFYIILSLIEPSAPYKEEKEALLLLIRRSWYIGGPFTFSFMKGKSYRENVPSFYLFVNVSSFLNLFEMSG